MKLFNKFIRLLVYARTLDCLLRTLTTQIAALTFSMARKLRLHPQQLDEESNIICIPDIWDTGGFSNKIFRRFLNIS